MNGKKELEKKRLKNPSLVSLPWRIVVPFLFLLAVEFFFSCKIGWTGRTINPKSLSGCVCFLSLLEVLTAHLLGGRESD